MQKNPTNIPVSIAGKTAAPRLDGVDRFQTAGKPEVLDLLHHQSRVFMQPVEILVETDDVAGILRELDIAGCRHAHCLLRVFCHGLRVDIDGAVLGLEDLIFEAADSRAPLSPGLVQQAARLFRVEENGPRAPAILHGQRIDFAENAGKARLGETIKRNYADVLSARPEVQCQRRNPAWRGVRSNIPGCPEGRKGDLRRRRNGEDTAAVCRELAGSHGHQ